MSLPPHMGDEPFEAALPSGRMRQKRTRKAPRASEAAIQIAIRDFLRLRGVRSRHVPNGGSRHPREALNLKRQGVVAGFPDLIVWNARGQVGFLEVKAESGRLSEAQMIEQDGMRADGLRVAVVRSVDDAAAALREWGWA